nr:hypothetical protein [Tanacetum cinerariifolium]
MTGNISYLSDYEPYDGGYVSFGQGGCKITGKGTIKTECILLGRDFKLIDDTNVLLRTPRQHNMYSIDLNNIVPHKDLTCLVAKASADESELWHRRLGKEHKASCKTKLVHSMTKSLHTLHMDLFGPTFDETSGILRNFITEIENLKDLKAEAVNTACYVQNKVLINKSHNKTPYKLFNGRTPAIGFLKPFGCYVMILNTLDHLRKFEAKKDECYFIGYSMSSKAFRVFNKRTKRVEENSHVDFLENKLIEKGASLNCSPVPTACLDDSPQLSSDTRLISKRVTSQDDTPSLDNILTLSNMFEDILGVTTNIGDSHEVEADLRNMENNILASHTPTLRIHKDHPTSLIIGPVDTPFCLFSSFLSQEEPKKIFDALKDPSWVEAMHEELLQFKIQNVWSLVDCPKRDPEFPARVYKVEKAMYGLHQAPKALMFCDYHNMIAILEKYEHNVDFHLIVDFVEASYMRVKTSDEGTKILAIVDGKPRTISESSIRRNLTLKDETGISSLPDAEIFENLTLMGTVPLFDTMLVHQGEGSGTPTKPHYTPSPKAPQSPQHDLSSSIHLPVTTVTIPTVIPTNTPPRQYTRRARIAYDSTPRVTSLAADEGSMQHKLQELMDLCTRLQRQQDEMVSKNTAQDLDISTLKARIKLLDDRDGGGNDPSGEDATIKGKSLETGGKQVSTVSIPSAGEIPTVSVPTGSGVVPTASPIFTTATVATPYSRRKGKEKTVESETPKKKKLQEQIDVQMARRLEEEMERNAQRMNEQIARDAEIARIHVEEELQMLIDSLDRNNETVAKYLQEYKQFAGDVSIRERIQLINDLVKYQDNYTKVLKYQSQQRKLFSKKQQKEFYMSVLRSHVLKKKEKDLKEKGSDEKESAKKVKTLEEVSEEDLKEMMQLVPVEELWALVKETLNIRKAISDKEKELWVELKRLYKPDVKDQLWTQTQALMHDPVEWRLYDTCGVHHVFSRDQKNFILVEKEYPLRKGLIIVMISNKLQVENYS